MAGPWSEAGFEQRFFDALAASGLDLSQLSVENLAAGDQIHAMGLAATRVLAASLDVPKAGRILDLGSGLGGPARYFAQRFHCRVSGIDITPEWVSVAKRLNQLTGYDQQVDFSVGDACALPYPDQTFDAVVCQHVTMNIADRSQLFREAYRVLKPGGALMLSEQSLGLNGQPHYPTPWSNDGSHSFLMTPAETEGTLVASGFRLAWITDSASEDLTGYDRLLQLMAQGSLAPYGSQVALGANAQQKIQNAADNIRQQHILPILLLAYRPAKG